MPYLTTLGRLCLVSKAFEQLARPRMYQHLLFSEEDVKTKQAAVLSSLALLRRTLCAEGTNRPTSGSGQRLAGLVRAIHITVDGDVTIGRDVLPLLDACSNTTFASFAILKPSLATQDVIADGVIHARLEQLKHLTVLDWRVYGMDLDERKVLAPLASAKLLRLRELDVTFTSGMTSTSPQVAFWPSSGIQGSLPALKHVKFDYIRVDRSGVNSSHSGFSSYEQAAHHIRQCLSALLREARDNLTLHLLTDEPGAHICHAVPESIVDKLSMLILPT